MPPDLLLMIERLSFAVLAGGIIGLERSYHGRPAGFRTHSLVCTASALLMLLMIYELQFVSAGNHLTIDPTRMAQGIMTGIGFLGAGVIMKDRLTIRGLTTAGSIWITASIGIVIGLGYYSAAIFATLTTLGTLSLFRWVEKIMPTTHYSRLSVRFHRRENFTEEELNALLSDFGLHAASISYSLLSEGRMFEYTMTIRGKHIKSFYELAMRLEEDQRIQEFEISPMGE